MPARPSGVVELAWRWPAFASSATTSVVASTASTASPPVTRWRIDADVPYVTATGRPAARVHCVVRSSTAARTPFDASTTTVCAAAGTSHDIATAPGTD